MRTYFGPHFYFCDPLAAKAEYIIFAARLKNGEFLTFFA